MHVRTLQRAGLNSRLLFTCAEWIPPFDSEAPEPVPGGEDALDVDADSLSDIFGISLD